MRGCELYGCDNGQKEEVRTWKDGKLDGPWTSRHEHGQKELEMTFKDGEVVETAEEANK